MLALRKTKRFPRLLTGALAVLAAAAGPAWAQGKLDAHYTVTLAGIPIGNGNWTIDITDTNYNASANGATTGLMRAFTGGQGTTNVQGKLNGGHLLSSNYAATVVTSKKTEEIKLTVSNGNVTNFKITPVPDKDPDRVPIKEEHQHGILDPMTASLLRMPGNGDPLSAEACQGTVAVFDGRLRYDLQLAFKRMDKVKAEKGYAGPVVVCAVYFSPIAGFNPGRYAIKYISELRDMEVWLAPIAGTRVLVPFRAQAPTPIGPAVMEATRFVSVATPGRTSGSGPKTQ